MIRKNSFFLCIFLIVICLATHPSLADTPSQSPPRIGKLPIQTWTTPQGAHVFFVPSPDLPMLDLRLLFPAGSSSDQDKFGISSLTNAVLMTGTKTFNADQIAKQFDQLGVSLSHDTNQDYAVLGLRSLSADQSLNPTIKLLAHILAAPSFPAKEFVRMQKQSLLAIQATQQAPGNVANDLFFKALYGKQAYAHPVLGTAETVAALTRQDLLRFYQAHYTANQASLILVGDITETQAKTIAEQLSAALPTATKRAPSPSPFTKEIRNASCQQVNFPSAQANILMGEIGIARDDPDFFPLMLGNHIIGGSGLSSRLFQEVRNKKGLVYSVYSGFMPLKEKGPFLIGLQSRNEKASEALSTVHETLSKFVKEGPSAEELASAKRNMIGTFYVNLASNSAMTSALSKLAFYQLPLDYFDTYTQKIQAVTGNQVRQAMQRHVHPDQLLTVIVGKAKCGVEGRSH